MCGFVGIVGLLFVLGNGDVSIVKCKGVVLVVFVFRKLFKIFVFFFV